jgi:predicted RND superfamily exporter protein
MPNYLEKRDRWGNSLALWVVFGMVFCLPPCLWALRSLKLENEVHHWIPHDDPKWQAYQFAERHFATADAILCSWDGSHLADPRVDRLSKRVRGTRDANGQRRGASPYFSEVKTPYDLIARIHSDKTSMEEAISRVEGVLVGRGPLRIRLTDEGRERRERVVRALTDLARAQIREPAGLQVAMATAPVVGESTLLDDEAGANAGADQAPAVVPEANRVNGGPGVTTPGGPAEAGGGTTGETVAQTVPTPIEPGAGEEAEEDEAGQQALSRESSLAELESLLPVAEPHDLELTWPGMHWRPEEVARVRELALHLGSVGGAVLSQPGAVPERPVVEACFQVPGSPVAVAVYLSEAGRAERGVALDWLKQAAVEAGIPEPTLHLAGSPVAGHALNAEVRKATWNPDAPLTRPHERSLFLVSSLVGGLFALWMLKSWRLALVVLGVSYYTTLLSTALVPLTGAPMNMVLVVMPTLLLVTTLSVAVHIANYWRHAAAVDGRTAVAQSIRTAYVPVLWAGVTSIIGQASLCTSNLTPIRDFGLFSSIGSALSLVVTLVGLPALMLLFPAKAPAEEELDSSFWHGLAAWIARHQNSVTAACLLAAAGCSVGLMYFRTETKVVRYFGEHTRTFRDYVFIEENLGGVVPVEVLVRFDREAQQELKFLQRRDLIREIEQQVRQLPDVSGVLSLSDFLPDYAAPTAGGGSKKRAQQRYATTSRVIESRVKSGRYAGTDALLAMCDDATPWNEAGDELWRITAQVAVLSDLHYGDLQNRLDEICQSVLSAASGSSAEKLPAPGVNRQYRPYASHLVTGLVPLFLATQDQLLSGFIGSFAGAFLSIAIVVMFVLRNPLAGFLAMIPNVLPIVAVFGVISWMGIQIDIGSTVTASIALGITIDGTLHLVTWFRQGIQEGKTRAEAVAQALGHCGPAMWQTTLIVSCGLIVLYPCDLVLISRFGWLMAVLLAAASISDLVLTPALLAGPLGALIEKTTPRTAEAGAATGHATATGPAPLSGPTSAPVTGTNTHTGIKTAEAASSEPPRGTPPAPHLDQRRIRISRPEN